MNGKKSKKLRRQAEAATVGRLAGAIVATQKNRTTAIHLPGTTRQIYQRLKK